MHLPSCKASTRSIGEPVTVKAGIVQGSPSKFRPDVSAYLGVPFGQPPVGDLRFEAPIAVESFNSSPFDASQFGPDCPSNHIPTNQAYIGGPGGGKILTSVAQTGRPYSEDCLSLNVWTKPQTGETSKAVLFFIFGGGFSIGNTAAEVYDGSVLADENDVVVVSTNYRVNVFGFSGGPGLTQNVGLLDQRLALEWTRDNIAAFGGDPSRITVFGQSAGGSSTDWLSLMYPDDPIAHGFIPQSGTATGGISLLISDSADALDSWYTISEALDCGTSEAGQATVACVKDKDTDAILKAIAENELVAIQSGFVPVKDDITVPQDAVDRVSSGNFAKVPILVGSTSNEAGFLEPTILAYTSLSESTVNALSPVVNALQPILDIATLVAFTCGSQESSRLRVEQGVTTYRYYYYGGNYTNTYLNYVGSAYHTSELPIVFGTAAEVTSIPDEGAQTVMGPFIRNSWAAFAKDPENGLANLGWPKYDPETKSLVALAVEGETVPSFTSSDDIDTLCSTINGVVNLLSGSTVTVMSTMVKAVRAVITDGPQAPAIRALMSDYSTPVNASSVADILHALIAMEL